MTPTLAQTPFTFKPPVPPAKRRTSKSATDSRVHALLKTLNSELGRGTVATLSDRQFVINRFSTGFPELDAAVGGGYPLGRITRLYGWESTGKSTLALHAIAQAQKADPRAAVLFNVDHSFCPPYAQAIGVDLDRLVVVPSGLTAEAHLDILLRLAKSKAVSLIVVDSTDALVTRFDKTHYIGDFAEYNAMLMGKCLKQLVLQLHSETAVLFTSQIRNRSKESAEGDLSFYPNPTGGTAIVSFSSLQIELNHSREIGGYESKLGIEVEARIVKNKSAAVASRPCFLELMFNPALTKDQHSQAKSETQRLNHLTSVGAFRVG